MGGFRGGRGTGGGFCFGLADVDAALEECAVFDGDAGSGDVAGECAFAADIDAVGGGDVAADFAEDDDFAGGDVGGDLAVAADGDAIAGEIDGSFDLAVDVEGFGAGDFAFDDEALADGGLVAGGSGGARGSLFVWGGGGLTGFPHKVWVIPFKRYFAQR